MVSDIPAGDGKMANSFLQCRGETKRRRWGKKKRDGEKNMSEEKVKRKVKKAKEMRKSIAKYGFTI